jgi:hypothetical protein
MRWSLASPARLERSLRREMATTPKARHPSLRIEFEAVADALRPGTRGAVQELAPIRHPWPFPLSDVETPVHLWHGALETNVPIATARRLAAELPHVSCTSATRQTTASATNAGRDHLRHRLPHEIEREPGARHHLPAHPGARLPPPAHPTAGLGANSGERTPTSF